MNDLCADCGLEKQCSGPVQGDGPAHADIMIVGEAPGADEDRAGTPFVGKVGELLDTMLRAAGLDRRDLYITHACKCRPPGNRTPDPKEIKACIGWLYDEISDVNPELIVTVGNTALKAVAGKSGITKARGIGLRVNVDGTDRDVLPTFHPAAVLRGREEYRSYIERDLKKAAAIVNGEAVEDRVSYTLIRTKANAARLVDELYDADRWTYDLETTGLDPRADDAAILCCGFCTEPKTAYVVPFAHPECPWYGDRGFMRDFFEQVMQSPAIKIAHNAKFDIGYIEHVAGAQIADPIDDTMLMHYLIDEMRGTHGLKKLAWDFITMGGYDRDLDAWFVQHGMKAKTSRQFAKVPLETLYKYCAADADATMRLHEVFTEKLSDVQRGLLDGLILPAMRVVVKMESRGMAVDRSYMDDLDKQIPERMRELETVMRGRYRPEVEAVELKLSEIEFTKRKAKLKNPDKATPKRFEFKWSSNAHLKMLLYDVLDLPYDSWAKTKTGPSVDVEAMYYILDRRPDMELIDDLLDWRKLKTLHGTFIRGLIEKISPADGRVHGQFNLHGTETGRLSSSNPNMQNIPRTKLIKNQFMSPLGWSIIQVDFSQVELRVAAMLSKDRTMTGFFHQGGDLHVETASRVYNVSSDKVTKEQRSLAKGVGFGILYGRGAPAISAATGVPEHEAEQFIKDYFNLYSGVNRWIKSMHKQAKRDGFVSTPFGRMRRLPGAMSDDKKVWLYAERQAANTPIQSTASDLTLMSLIELDAALDERDAVIVSTVHDSIILYARDGCIDDTARTCKRIMEHLSGLPDELTTVPIIADVEVGKRWGELEKWEDG